MDKYEYLTGEEILSSNQRQIIEQAKQKTDKKQVGTIKSLDLSNKKNQLKQIEGIFPQNLMNDSVCAKLNEIVNLQDIIKTDEPHYKSKRKKVYNFNEYYLPIVF